MHAAVAGLTEAGCRARQRRLAESLASFGRQAAVIGLPGHVHWLSGVWTRSVFAHVLLVRADGTTVLAMAEGVEERSFADETVAYPGSLLATMVEDPLKAAMKVLGPRLKGLTGIVTDMLPDGGGWMLRDVDPMDDIGDTIRRSRRTKLADEVGLLECGVKGCEAAYARAREIVRPGLTEWEMYTEIYAAALKAVGEPIGEFGNDFQSGGGGGPARHRAMEAGELLTLDLSVVVRGYSSDMCRTIAVDGKPTEAQVAAHARVVEALDFVERTVRPGVNCKKLFSDVSATLDGYRGWHFGHHLGHGIGLSAHEAPRINPNWDDVFQEGDVFTAEPGLYGSDLRGGIRLEQDYVVTGDGVRRLSQCSLEL